MKPDLIQKSDILKLVLRIGTIFQFNGFSLLEGGRGAWQLLHVVYTLIAFVIPIWLLVKSYYRVYKQDYSTSDA